MVIFFIISGFLLLFFFFLITFTTFDLFFNVLCATFLGNQLNDPHNFVLNREIRNNLLYIASGL